ncbi:MAG: polynucleotide adenylyltransferase PcnB [Gammaproteobacteria bacterium]|nr:polynucleotide adenylyltransferase PcnB [Gammaproteobacteria bacterium]
MTRLYRPEELPAGLAFERGWISAGALRVAETLQAAGFDGYLVGGCVRDLLLRRRPKDFDIATDAGPEQVRDLFRRARLIGRRFKIVHVRAGREIIEVATYRAKPGDASPGGAGRVRVSQRGRVVDDNVFGSIEQDAARRDFTINALYYDPVRARVADFLGGVKDAKRGVLRMIGEPRERFTEDPVRMLRAARFRAKLGLAWDARLAPAVADCLELLDDVPSARLYDEALKLFHHGHALAVWDELRAHGLAARMFPLTAAALGDGAGDGDGRGDGKRGRGGGDGDGGGDRGGQGNPNRAADLIRLGLKNTDQRISEGKTVIPAFLFAVLLWRPFQLRLAARHPAASRLPPSPVALADAADAVFAQQAKRVAVPRRVSGAVERIWALQFELEQRRPRSVPRLLAEPRFRAAYDFLDLRARTGETGAELVEWWTAIQEDPAMRERAQSLPGKPEPARSRMKTPGKSRAPSHPPPADLPPPPPGRSSSDPVPPGRPRPKPRSRLASSTTPTGDELRRRSRSRAGAGAGDSARRPAAKPRHKNPRQAQPPRPPKPTGRGNPESE